MAISETAGEHNWISLIWAKQFRLELGPRRLCCAIKEKPRNAEYHERARNLKSALDVTLHEAWYDEGPKEYDIPGNPEEGTGDWGSYRPDVK